MATETELKLAIAAADVARLARSPLLAAASRSRASTRTVYSVYYDTPEQDLVRLGMALRLRRVAGRWVQTLKTAGTAQAGLHQRGEFEAPAAMQWLNVAALAATPAAEFFADPQLRARLQPQFVTQFKRTLRLVEIHPGELAEFCIDRGTITAGTRQCPISEIELELKQGEPAHLFEFARRLLDEVPVRVANVSKAERGYALLGPDTARPTKASVPPLEGAMTVPVAFQAIVGECLRQLQANEEGVLSSDDVEYVHQARVAIRRLRSAFGLFRKVVPKAAVASLLAGVKALGASLGATRDWDVFLTQTLPAARDAFPDHPGFDTIAAHATAAQSAARTQARLATESATYTALLLELGAQMSAMSWRGRLEGEALVLESRSVEDFAAVLLDRQWRRVRRSGREHHRLSPPELHALRIEVKKLRYAVEFFQGLHARKSVKAFLDHAAELQAILGTMNDATVTSHLLDRMTPDTSDGIEAVGIVRGWISARGQQGLEHLDAAWKRFAAAKPYW